MILHLPRSKRKRKVGWPRSPKSRILSARVTRICIFHAIISRRRKKIYDQANEDTSDPLFSFFSYTASTHFSGWYFTRKIYDRVFSKIQGNKNSPQTFLSLKKHFSSFIVREKRSSEIFSCLNRVKLFIFKQLVSFAVSRCVFEELASRSIFVFWRKKIIKFISRSFERTKIKYIYRKVCPSVFGDKEIHSIKWSMERECFVYKSGSKEKKGKFRKFFWCLKSKGLFTNESF